MKKRIPHKQNPGKNSHKAYAAKTGEHCPSDGWWAPTGLKADRRFIAEGSIMPADNGKSVTWILVASESGSRKPKYDHTALGASIDSH
ncbi:hypothetical protein [Arthrobacter sp. 4R501]|uniref:hypothetical protein n=1 Tax=Arthrobacter sp. 4R501 TaxID=2058886 RepID=UPI0015E33E3A|nr:hypothetical protein [Arthrobacter sp. 4R501]